MDIGSTDGEVLRVVTLRRNKYRLTDFKLREGERGLSLFATSTIADGSAILQAVREAGKQGELGIAMVSAVAIRSVGLVLVKTPGGTPSDAVNALHREARLPIWRTWWLRLCRRSPVDYFNEQMSPRIYAAARSLEPGEGL